MNFWITGFWGLVSGNWSTTISRVAGMRSPSAALPASRRYSDPGWPWPWNRGALIPNFALFLARMAPAGPLVQTTIAWGAALLILVSCAVMLVSLGAKD